MAERAAEERAGVPALEVAGLSHSFGKRKALDDVSFAIAPGSFTVLLGQNGAGKTTLFNLITRLYSNRTGSIRIFGTEVRTHPRRALAAARRGVPAAHDRPRHLGHAEPAVCRRAAGHSARARRSGAPRPSSPASS